VADEEKRVEVPAVLAELWGRAEPGRRGPKRSLDLVRIGTTAVTLADTEGWAAVSMKRVAQDLGVSTMALYRYVDTKDDLHLVMLEVAAGAAPDTAGRSWRDGLETWARGYRAILLQHPWVLAIPLSGPPATPRQLDWMEAAMVPLRVSGLALPEQMQVLLQVNVYVRGDVALLQSLVVGEGMASATWGSLVAELADPDRYPNVFTAIGAGEFDEDDDPVDQFEFGLARIMDGIEALLAKRR
jgi:AcrR family transcriptional regulator